MYLALFTKSPFFCIITSRYWLELFLSCCSSDIFSRFFANVLLGWFTASVTQRITA